MNDRRPLRADAAANRSRIVAAARQVYAEFGPAAAFDAIATRAGVANATLYRHFPNSEALHTAIYAQRLAETDAFLQELDAEPHPWTAVERYLQWIAANPDVSLVDIIFDPDANPDLAPQHRTLRARAERVFARARAAGVVRPDVTIEEIEVVIYAMAQVGVAPRISPPQRARFTRLILDGLRAP